MSLCKVLPMSVLFQPFDHFLERTTVVGRCFQEILEGIDLEWLGQTLNESVPEPEVCRQGSLTALELVKKAVGIEGTGFNLGHIL